MAEESFAAGLVGIVLDGRYRLDALLGEGGMGAVYRAHHLAMDRRVAVKLLKPHLTTDDAALQRFVREARSTMRVDSDHAVKVLDFGVTPMRDYYMVLEYLDGRTVQKELDVDGPFEPARVVHIAKQACHALGAAHASGLVHRDIKPDNILLMRAGDDPDYAKVLDFGVAKVMEGAARSDRSALALTQAGMVFGTPEFMSPEQACGQQLDGRSDLYSLAATMFAMLTGCGLFRAKSALEWLTNHARTPPPHLADGAPALAPYTELDLVLQRCLAKHKESRPQTAAEMAQLLARVQPTLGKGRAALPAMKGATFSPSTFIPAISVGAATMLSSELPQQAPPALPTPTTGVQAPARRSGAWLALGALVVAGLIATTIVLATRKRDHAATPPVAKRVDTPIADAAPVDVAAVDAAVPVDAAPADAPTDTRATKPDTKVRAAEVNKLIAEAEAAKQAHNLVRWVMKADAALQLDPHSVKARFLLADGLIASGDLDRGCKYLRELGRNPMARARASQAGCPAD